MRVVALILVFSALISCRGNSPAISHEKLSLTRKPAALQLDREISGQVLSYRLKGPSGVAISATGELYISDTDNHRLVKFDRNLAAIREYGGYGSSVGKFRSPEDIYIDRGLNLYVVDAGNRRIVQLDANLNYAGEFEAEDDSLEIISTLGSLSGVAVSSSGEITVADFDNSRLIRMDNFKRFSRYIGDFGYGDGSLLNPLGLAKDKKERIYVADAGNGRIAFFDDYGNFISEIGRDKLGRPSAVCVGGDGIVWVGDEELDCLFAFAPDGRLLFREGTSGRMDMEFGKIAGLAVSSDGLLYVADAGNNRIMIYRISYEDN